MIDDTPISLTVIEYDHLRNVFAALLDDTNYRVEFDPFVTCAIPLSDAEYFLGHKARSLIGHKFTVKRSSFPLLVCQPMLDDIISTTYMETEERG